MRSWSAKVCLFSSTTSTSNWFTSYAFSEWMLSSTWQRNCVLATTSWCYLHKERQFVWKLCQDPKFSPLTAKIKRLSPFTRSSKKFQWKTPKPWVSWTLRLTRICISTTKPSPTANWMTWPCPRKSDTDRMSIGIASTSDAMSTFLSAIKLHAEIEPKGYASRPSLPSLSQLTFPTNRNVADVDSPLENKPTYVVELDDKLDEHFVTLLMDPKPPKEMHLCNTEILPGVKLSSTSNVQYMCLIRCLEWPETREQRVLDKFFNEAITSLYNSILFKVRLCLLKKGWAHLFATLDKNSSTGCDMWCQGWDPTRRIWWVAIGV